MLHKLLHSDHPLSLALQPIKEAIASDLQKMDRKNFLIDYPLIAEENAKGSRLHDLTDQIFPDTSIEEQHLLHQVTILRQKSIHAILKNLVTKESPVLEVGSGTLDNRGDSYLSGAIEREPSKQFFFCDVNPTMVERSLQNNPKARITCTDSKNLREVYGKKKWDFVVGHNVFDTMTQNELNQTLKEVRFLLSPTGKFVHILNMEPFIYATVHDLCQKELIVLPQFHLTEKNSFTLFEKNRYKEAKKILDPVEKSFLDYLFSLSSNQMEKLCNALIHLQDQKPLHDLSLKLKPYSAEINLFDYHIQTLVYSLPKHGLHVTLQKFYEQEAVIKVQVNGKYEGKCLEYSPQGKRVSDDPTLSWGECRLKIETHGLIADKRIR